MRNKGSAPGWMCPHCPEVRGSRSPLKGNWLCEAPTPRKQKPLRGSGPGSWGGDAQVTNEESPLHSKQAQHPPHPATGQMEGVKDQGHISSPGQGPQ